jgi:23S rRNA (adenine1618-N6)-methyltransferase
MEQNQKRKVQPGKKSQSGEKSRLHPRNRNREAYDLQALTQCVPALGAHVGPNKHGNDSVDFANPAAVKLLNQALLHHYYGISDWDFPDGNLCPPIPGRVDYIHALADLLGASLSSESGTGEASSAPQLTGLDVGVGASCIYPLLGIVEYGWNFVCSDTSAPSLASAQRILDANPALQGRAECRLQPNSQRIFKGVIQSGDRLDFTMCNPPFHASAAEAEAGTRRKVRNLSGARGDAAKLNFSGAQNELIYPGGEAQFIRTMISDSRGFANQVLWFSTLVSKQANLHPIEKSLKKAQAADVRTISLGTGTKSSRIVAWTFLTSGQRAAWRQA